MMRKNEPNKSLLKCVIFKNVKFSTSILIYYLLSRLGCIFTHKHIFRKCTYLQWQSKKMYIDLKPICDHDLPLEYCVIYHWNIVMKELNANLWYVKKRSKEVEHMMGKMYLIMCPKYSNKYTMKNGINNYFVCQSSRDLAILFQYIFETLLQCNILFFQFSRQQIAKSLYFK